MSTSEEVPPKKEHCEHQEKGDDALGKSTEKNEEKIIKKQVKFNLHDNEDMQGKDETKSKVSLDTDEDERPQAEDQIEEEGPVGQYVTILLTKHQKNQEDEEGMETAVEATHNIETMVTGWYERDIIAGVKDMYDNKTITTFNDYNLYLSEARVSGRDTTRVEIFFTIDTTYSVRELIEEDLPFLKRENLWLEEKRTENEHTNKVGFLSGPIVEKANMKWYDGMMKLKAEIGEGLVEIKKGPVYEGREEARCITVHSVKSVSDHIDFKLRKMSAESGGHIKYISFKHSSKRERIASLQLNKILNGPNKYEWFENTAVLETVYFKGKEMTFSQVIMDAKSNGIRIFNGVEQGFGMNENRVYVYFKPNMQKEAREWIQKHYGKDFKVKNMNEYTTSVPTTSPEEVKVNNEIQDYILERLKEVRIDDSKRRKSYSDIVKTGYKVHDGKDDGMELSSDEDTCRMSNKSNEEDSFEEEDTKCSKSTMKSRETAQSKAIEELQKTVQSMQKVQDRMMEHMKYLEDTIVVLSEPDDGSIEYKKRTEVAKKIKRKRKTNTTRSGDDEDSIEVKRQEKRRSPRLEILKRTRQNKQEEGKIESKSKIPHQEIAQNLDGVLNKEEKENESN
jgi:hypothetical protein